jgi:hypothetical protein
VPLGRVLGRGIRHWVRWLCLPEVANDVRDRGSVNVAAATVRRLRRLILAFATGLASVIALPGIALAYTDPGRPESTSAVPGIHAGPAVASPASVGTGATTSSMAWLMPTLAGLLALVVVASVVVMLRRAARRGAPRPTSVRI